jgi:uncharacterized protein (DUF302 family)
MSDTTDIVTKTAVASVEETVAKLQAEVERRGLQVFAVIDHSGEARRQGLELRDTKVVMFGSPRAGTPVMAAAPLIALDLPLKVLVFDDRGTTTLSYLTPDALVRRYGLETSHAETFVGSGLSTYVPLGS